MDKLNMMDVMSEDAAKFQKNHLTKIHLANQYSTTMARLSHDLEVVL